MVSDRRDDRMDLIFLQNALHGLYIIVIHDKGMSLELPRNILWGLF